MHTICDKIKKGIIDEYADDGTLLIYLRHKIERFKTKGSFDNAIIYIDRFDGITFDTVDCWGSPPVYASIHVKFNSHPEEFMSVIEFIERMIECESL